eukprot:TRINITY_DN7393_c0_g1_i1.p1 TRINITY_DN7393_c0_g1~~TRINITY_DN7393_c0_g1_i1.p1  ORF type:complete len:322 (+),score=62.65 TRINITY_DN7393_c0_g1_i1:480-1445(+)
MILFSCRGKVLPLDQDPQDCNMPCDEFLQLWGVGGPPMAYPEEVGIPFDSSAQYVVLQIHYDNLLGRSDVVDSSGFKIYYTETLRKYDLGVMTLGSLSINIPPQKTSVELVADCPSSCTEGIPSTGLKVVGSGLHMHQLGRSIYTQIIRKGTELPDLGRIPHFDFNYQNIYSPADASFDNIMPGDRLITHCEWSSLTSSKTVKFGEGTTDEMCFNFIFYYPKINFDTCIQYSNWSVCGKREGLTISLSGGLRFSKVQDVPFTPLPAQVQCLAPSQSNRTTFIPTTPSPTMDVSSSATALANLWSLPILLSLASIFSIIFTF